MKTHRILCAAVLSLAISPLAIALPAAGQQAQSDIQRMEEMLKTAPDHGGLWLAMATVQARAGNKAEALRWLEKVVSRGLDFDLPDDLPGKAAFAQLRETPEMKELLARAAANRRVVNRGRVAFRIPEKDLIPEGITHDPETGAFYVGSINKRKIVRIDKAGKASDFTASGQDGLWDVLGLRVDPAARTLWACSAAGPSSGELDGTSSLFRYDLATGKLLSRHDLPGQPHLCNDIALGKEGDVFVTDSKGGMLHRLRRQAENYRLETWVGPGTFIYPNGLAISPDLSKLFVADFKKGLSIVDVATGQVRPLPSRAGPNRRHRRALLPPREPGSRPELLWHRAHRPLPSERRARRNRKRGGPGEPQSALRHPHHRRAGGRSARRHRKQPARRSRRARPPQARR